MPFQTIITEIQDGVMTLTLNRPDRLMWRMAGADHPMQAHRIDSRAIAARSVSADAAEGVASFLEKRAPAFTDRVSAQMPGFFPWWTEPGWSVLQQQETA